MGGLGAFWLALSPDQRMMVIDLAATVVLPFVIAVAARLYKVWMSRLPASQHALASDVVGQVVAAVEQLYASAPSGTGAAKKAEALKLAAALLRHFGVPASEDLLNVLIEAAVAGLNAGQGVVPSPVAAPPAQPPAVPVAPVADPLLGGAALTRTAAIR